MSDSISYQIEDEDDEDDEESAEKVLQMIDPRSTCTVNELDYV